MNMQIIELVFRLLLFVSVFCAFGGFAKYLHDYNIISLLIARIKGDIYEYDRVRRTQMKKDIEERRGVLNSNDSKRKIPIISKIYKRIEMTGITLKIPAFSEMTFLIVVIGVALVIGLLTTLFLSPLVALVAMASFLILIWYALGILIYNRRLNVDSQLLQFTNSAASASRQYSNIIDIIGAIYDQFEGAFREALEACYVEAKTTNDSSLAFTHLKQKFDSLQLAFVIDNLIMCSASTGDYYVVATDLSKTVAIYANSHEKMATTLRNAKLNISIMFVVAIVIMYSLGTFFESGLTVVFGSPIGIILCIILVLIYIFGISARAE